MNWDGLVMYVFVSVMLMFFLICKRCKILVLICGIICKDSGV